MFNQVEFFQVFHQVLQSLLGIGPGAAPVTVSALMLGTVSHSLAALAGVLVHPLNNRLSGCMFCSGKTMSLLARLWLI